MMILAREYDFCKWGCRMNTSLCKEKGKGRMDVIAVEMELGIGDLPSMCLVSGLWILLDLQYSCRVESNA